MTMFAMGLGRNDPQTATRECIRAMAEFGAVKLEASYSGGNDEGGVDGIKLFNAKGEEVPAPEMWIQDPTAPADRPWEGSKYHPLFQAADNILETEYGTWAGEFTAWGTLYVDAAQNKAWREGSYETPDVHNDYAEF